MPVCPPRLQVTVALLAPVGPKVEAENLLLASVPVRSTNGRSPVERAIHAQPDLIKLIAIVPALLLVTVTDAASSNLSHLMEAATAKRIPPPALPPALRDGIARALPLLRLGPPLGRAGHRAAAKRAEAVLWAATVSSVLVVLLLLFPVAGRSRARPRPVRREPLEPALVQRAADGDADADHRDGNFGGGPDDKAYCVVWVW